MARFRRKVNVKQDIPTASVPDVVFMLLFFFMVTTQLRDTSILVEQNIPEASQLKRIQRKSLVAYLYIGEPKKAAFYGREPRIQADDVFIEPKDIVQWVNSKKSLLTESESDQFTVSLKVDEDTRRGIVVDVETELRRANARRLLYTTNVKKEKN